MATRSTPGKLQALIDQVKELEDLGGRVQGDDETDGLAAAEDLTAQYRRWFSACLEALPDDLREKFRFEYEGKLSLTQLNYRIKHFLQEPRVASAVYRDDMDDASKRIFSPWQHPYKDRFLGPVRQQQSYLEEALARYDSGSAVHESLDLLERLGRRFAASCALLQREHRGKPGIIISDEYDVQHILHAMIVPHFEEVEPEEPTPKMAGGSARLDFLLKQDHVAIETKMMRPSLSLNELRRELAEDIIYFRAHPHVSALFILVYDPERRITNNAGFERDLSSDSDSFIVRVVVGQ